jgi:hypothetical protein
MTQAPTEGQPNFEYEEFDSGGASYQVHKVTEDEAGTYQTPGGVTNVAEGEYLSPTPKGDVFLVFTEDEINSLKSGESADETTDESEENSQSASSKSDDETGSVEDGDNDNKGFGSLTT